MFKKARILPVTVRTVPTITDIATVARIIDLNNISKSVDVSLWRK